MKSGLTIVIFIGLISTGFANTTVYEMKDKEGTPTFTNVPQPNAKKIVIPDAPTPDEKAININQKDLEQQSQNISKQLQQIDNTEQQLKDQVDLAQSNLQQAQKNLTQARKAMADGTYQVGGDQFIDEDYIHHLEEQVGTAKQQLAEAKEAYNSYRNQHK